MPEKIGYSWTWFFHGTEIVEGAQTASWAGLKAIELFEKSCSRSVR
jgi:hypothetical protein